jgi:hypothetical protein
MPAIIQSKKTMIDYARRGGFHGAEVAMKKYGIGRETIIQIIEDMQFSRYTLTITARKRVMDKILERVAMMRKLQGEQPYRRSTIVKK